MSRLRVFISHSSGDEVELLDRVCHELEHGHGYEILVDRRSIRAADEWRERIVAMIAECHAAVILFSPRALASAWVHAEATALSWRRALDPDFRLIIVRFPGVSEKSLRNGRFEPLALGRVQQREAEEPAQVVSAVTEALADRRPFATHMDLVDGGIATLLRKADLDDDGLESVCETHFGPIGWKPARDRRATLARELSRKVLREGAGNLRTAVSVLDSFSAALTRDTAGKILRILEPFWVEAAAAGTIPLVALRQGKSRDAALNGEYFANFTAELYLRRAYPLSSSRTVVWVDDGGDGDFAGYVAARVRADLRNRFWRLRKLSDDEIDAFLNDPEGPPLPLFIMVPRLPPDTASLAELRKRFSKATYIFWTGRELPGPKALCTGIRGLEPALLVENETAALRARQHADMFLANLPD
ncbi:MAG TPA: toll/interleukin-1 receptor domain-containing protein [Longimicrobium sp.]|nr:toll/interleukin-1 receptor domain-containing protein [Longimicrobium sp.]